MSLTLIMTTAPTRGTMVSMYLSIYLSIYSYVCIIYSAFVTPWFPRSVYVLKCSVYSGILMCSHHGLQQHSTEQQGRLELLIVYHEDYRRRQVGECVDTWYKYGFSLLRQWSCSCPAACQHASVNQKQSMSLLYCCFVTFISTKARH